MFGLFFKDALVSVKQTINLIEINQKLWIIVGEYHDFIYNRVNSPWIYRFECAITIFCRHIKTGKLTTLSAILPIAFEMYIRFR